VKSTGSRHWPGILATIMLLAVLLLLVWLLPVFHLSEIETHGLRTLDETEIKAVSGLTPDQHLLRGLGGSLTHILQLRYAFAENNLKAAYPSIRTAVVQMDFPRKIIIDIEERVEVAYLLVPDGCAVIDKSGYLIDILPTPPLGIPVINGLKVTSMTLGQAISVDVPTVLNSAISLMGAIIDADKDDRTDLKLLPTISTILPVGGRNLYMVLILPGSRDELHVAVEIGPDLREDMLWLRFAVAQGVLDNRGKGILDLTGTRRTFIPD